MRAKLILLVFFVIGSIPVTSADPIKAKTTFTAVVEGQFLTKDVEAIGMRCLLNRFEDDDMQMPVAIGYSDFAPVDDDGSVSAEVSVELEEAVTTQGLAEFYFCGLSLKLANDQTSSPIESNTINPTYRRAVPFAPNLLIQRGRISLIGRAVGDDKPEIEDPVSGPSIPGRMIDPVRPGQMSPVRPIVSKEPVEKDIHLGPKFVMYGARRQEPLRVDDRIVFEIKRPSLRVTGGGVPPSRGCIPEEDPDRCGKG